MPQSKVTVATEQLDMESLSSIQSEPTISRIGQIKLSKTSLIYTGK